MVLSSGILPKAYVYQKLSICNLESAEDQRDILCICLREGVWNDLYLVALFLLNYLSQIKEWFGARISEYVEMFWK